MLRITKNIRKIKIIGILFFFLFFSLTPLPEQKAKAWETWGSIPMGVGIQEVIDQLLIVITGAAKQAAIKMITEKVYSAVSGEGGSGGTKFIVNWEGALETDPQTEAIAYLDDLASSSFSGRGSSANYESADDSTEWASNFEGVGEEGLAQYFGSPRFIDSAKAQSSSSSGGNYMASLKNLVTGITSQATSSNKCPVSYTGNPANMFADGTFKNFSKFMSGNNNPWSYQTCMQSAYQEKLTSIKEIAKTKAISYAGFIGTGSNGMVSYPGSLIKEKLANVENMGNQAITSARGIAEVITSAVMKMAMDAMNNGIGNVQAQIQKKATDVSNKVNTQVQNQIDNYGPGALYGNPSSGD
ncbi:hypothetical protein KJ761_02160 [Patescibacteria group bacterium]|nr:hypothetical protein [Patescibacteria group bacterium]